MARSTVDVDKVREVANAGLSVADSSYHLDGMTPEQAFRLGVASVLEAVLHATGNYRGFGFLASELTDSGTLREGHDDTRRRYF